jgi:hypothetical protein
MQLMKLLAVALVFQVFFGFSTLVRAEGGPAITQQPSDASFLVGRQATLTVEAAPGSGGSLSYQWYSNTTRSTTGATVLSTGKSSSLLVSSSTPGSLYYYVKVSEGGKSVDSNFVRVTATQGKTWNVVGSSDFSAGEAENMHMAHDNTGVPYVAYKDLGLSGKLVVKKFNGTAWVNVGGPSISPSEVNSLKLAFINQTPYVAYADMELSGKLVVKTWDGTQWTDVGSPGISSGEARYIDFKANNGTLYVVYLDLGTSTGTAKVKKFDGSNWVSVGAETLSAKTSRDYSMAFYDNVAYVAFVESGYVAAQQRYIYQLVFKKESGGAWVDATTPVPTVQPYFTSLEFLDGTPYIAYDENADGLSSNLKKWNGSGWQQIGYNRVFSQYNHLSVHDGVLDWAHSSFNEVYVKAWNNGVLTITGSADLSGNNEIDHLSTSAWNGEHYAAFQERYKTKKVIVKKLTAPSDNADLSSLAISAGTLSPSFSPSVTNYSVTLGSSSGVTGVKLTPTAAHGKATVKVNDAAVTSGAQSANIAVSAGTKVIYVDVQAEDYSVKTYTVTVTMLRDAMRPNITIQPYGQTVNVGSTANLSVTASASPGALSYQWYSNSSSSVVGAQAITDATSRTYSAPTDQLGDTYYYVVVTNTDATATGSQTASVQSNIVKLAVAIQDAPAPTITEQPADVNTGEGGQAALSVAATVPAGGALSYQWYSNTTNSNEGWTAIDGATSTSYSAPTDLVGSKYYYVVLTNTDNRAIRNKKTSITSQVARVRVSPLDAAEPVIISQPQDVSVGIGRSITLTVEVSPIDMASLTYQWYQNSVDSTINGILLPGVTSATYSPSTVTLGTYYYYATVTNTDTFAVRTQTASTTSRAAKVTVNELTYAAMPIITSQPQAQTLNYGQPWALSVVASAPNVLSYQWYKSESLSNSGGMAVQGATGATLSSYGDAIGTFNYYVEVMNTDDLATGDQTAMIKSPPVLVTVNLPAPLNVAVTAGNGQASIQWESVTGATYYSVYMSTTPGLFSEDSAIQVNEPSYLFRNLPNGTPHYFIVVAGAIGGSSQPSNEVTATPVSPSIDTPAPNDGAPSNPASNGFDVLVNGKAENAGTAKTEEKNGQQVLTIVVDEAKLLQRVAAEGRQAVITIPVASQNDVVVGELNGRMIKSMESSEAVIEVVTPSASYTLPSKQIDIDSLAAKFGGNPLLQDIKVRIEISKPAEAEIRAAQAAAESNGLSMVVPPLHFAVTATYDGETKEVSAFNAYIKRSVTIPQSVDPDIITTGVVLEQNGTVRHVPTRLIKKDGTYKAEISSLTNSLYGVVWNPVTFNDVEQHWSKDAVNNMGSRMVINGAGNGLFLPNQDITRAEFAAIIVRGLGLPATRGAQSFSDVSKNDWYADVIYTAHAYGLIAGFDDGSFRPNDKITREQAMVMVSKAMKLTKLQGAADQAEADRKLRVFADAASASEWARGGIADSVAAGIVTGRQTDQLAPQAFITKAEAATVMQLLLQKSGLID